MQKRIINFLAFSTLLFVMTTALFAAERIVVVGDSITGHSMNLPYGFTHEVRAALKAADVNDVEFVPLGGSGQTIISWQNIIENSYKNEQKLDIPNIVVKKELDKGADTILVHLGMNDALRPTVVLTPESLANWKAEYQKLVNALKKRVAFKKLILSPPTMLTESPYYYKNILMDRLGEIVQEVANANGAEFLDLRGDFQRLFLNARLNDEKFRITLDFVHPNQPGHQVMTWSILKGIGQEKAAAKYYAEKVNPKLRDFTSPGLCLFVIPTNEPNKILIKGTLRGYKVSELKVTPPNGIKFEKAQEGKNGEFTLHLSGHSKELSVSFPISAGSLTRSVKLNAPYFVRCNFTTDKFYPRPEDFVRATAVTSIDRDILANKDPFAIRTAQNTDWIVYYPTSDATGAENSCALDFCTMPLAGAYDAAYLVRYVYSPKTQKATLKLNSEGFSTTAINTIYLNGKEIYFGCLSPRHIKAKDELTVELKEGRNILVARVDHTFWQWAMSFRFEADGLTY